MSAIAEGVTFLNVVTHLTTPITYLAIVFAPGMYGAIVDSDLSLLSSFAFEIGGLVHVAINATAYSGNGIGSGKMFQTTVHGQSFGLEGFFECSNTMGDLDSLGVVSMEILDFTLQGGVVLSLQGPVYQISKLHAFGQ